MCRPNICTKENSGESVTKIKKEKRKYATFVDLEKAYDMENKNGLWEALTRNHLINVELFKRKR